MAFLFDFWKNYTNCFVGISSDIDFETAAAVGCIDIQAG